MPEGAASHQDGGKLGRPHEVEGLARMDCTRLPPEEIVFAPSGRGTMEKFIHQENLALFRRRLAEVRGESERAGAFETAGGGRGERAYSRKGELGSPQVARLLFGPNARKPGDDRVVTVIP